LPSLELGQIVWAEIADANGVRKVRPAVVVTPTKRIMSNNPVDVVAITSTLPQPLSGEYVLLPWHSQGHPRTGLNRKCAAMCNWVARILPSDIQTMVGSVPAPLMLEILKKTVTPPPPKSTPGEP
jgi:mRNA-degrading endonuclease toxin of MazEF toxin-antitoxin module